MDAHHFNEITNVPKTNLITHLQYKNTIPDIEFIKQLNLTLKCFHTFNEGYLEKLKLLGISNLFLDVNYEGIGKNCNFNKK